MEEALHTAQAQLRLLEAQESQQQEAMRAEREKAEMTTLKKVVEGAQQPTKETFNLRIENKNTDPIFVAIIGKKGLLSYTNELLILPQEIKPSESVTIPLPKESQVYKRWLCWDTKPLIGTTCSNTIPLEHRVTQDDKVISLMTPERTEALEWQKISAPSPETFSLHLVNKNLKPVYVALVGRKAPSGYIAGPLSYVTRMVYTDHLLTQSQEIKPSESITIAVPKETGLYQRWICWDNKPITSTSCSSTIPLDNRVTEDDKTLDVLSPERANQIEEELLEEKLAALRSEINVIQPREVGVIEKKEGEDTYLLKIRNIDTKPLHVALVAGIVPTQGIASYLGSWSYRNKLLTHSLEITPLKSITLRLPKIADINSLWLFWDEKPIECKNESCKGSRKNLGVIVHEDKKTIKIMTEERQKYLNKAAERLILQRNTEPLAQNTATTKQQSSVLPIEEAMFIEKRDGKVLTALPTILGYELPRGHKIPRIGIAYSGGGLRAMFSSLGFTLGLRNAGILNAIEYTSGLSGSTWFLMKWLEQGGDPAKLDAIAQTLRESMAKGLLPKQLLDPVTKELSQWAAFKELSLGGIVELDPNFNAQFRASLICPDGMCTKRSPSMIDLWGYFLGRRLFKGNANKYQFTLSSLKDTALKAQMPLPIFTAVDSQNTKTYIDSMTKWAWSNHEQEPPKDYKWFEATPFSTSIRSLRGPTRFLNGG